MKSGWILVHNKTGKPRIGEYSGGTTVFTKKTHALVETMDFPQYHVEKVWLSKSKGGSE